jgi:hypothetical protein
MRFFFHVFRDFSTSVLHNERGQFKGCTDAEGHTISVSSYTSPNAGLIANVTLRHNVNNGPWTIVRQVNYDYYDGTSNKPYGNLGDLRTATILDGNNNVIDVNYYRYYTSADAGNIGYVHGLKYVFSPQSYARLVADISNPLTATDAQVAPYADDYYQYNPTTQQVTEAVVQGSGCSVCAGGQGTFTYSYSNSTNQQGYNSWKFQTECPYCHGVLPWAAAPFFALAVERTSIYSFVDRLFVKSGLATEEDEPALALLRFSGPLNRGPRSWRPTRPDGPGQQNRL